MEDNDYQNSGAQIVMSRRPGSDTSEASSGNHLVVTGLYEVEGQDRKSSISFDKIKQISLTYSLQSEDDERQISASDGNAVQVSNEVDKISDSASNSRRVSDLPDTPLQDEVAGTECSCCEPRLVAQEARSSARATDYEGDNYDRRLSARAASFRARKIADSYCEPETAVGQGHDDVMSDEDEEDANSVVFGGETEVHRGSRGPYKRETKSSAYRDLNNNTSSTHRRSLKNATRSRQTQPDFRIGGDAPRDFSPIAHHRSVDFYERGDDYDDIYQSYRGHERMTIGLETKSSPNYDQYRLKNRFQQPRYILPNDVRRNLPDEVQSPILPTMMRMNAVESTRYKQQPVFINQLDGVNHRGTPEIPLIADEPIGRNIENLINYEDEERASHMSFASSRPSGNFRPRPHYQSDRNDQMRSAMGTRSSKTPLTSPQVRTNNGLIRCEKSSAVGSSRLCNTSVVNQPMMTTRSEVSHLLRW